MQTIEGRVSRLHLSIFHEGLFIKGRACVWWWWWNDREELSKRLNAVRRGATFLEGERKPYSRSISPLRCGAHGLAHDLLTVTRPNSSALTGALTGACTRYSAQLWRHNTAAAPRSRVCKSKRAARERNFETSKFDGGDISQSIDDFPRIFEFFIVWNHSREISNRDAKREGWIVMVINLIIYRRNQVSLDGCIKICLNVFARSFWCVKRHRNGTKIVEIVACQCTVRLKMYARSLFLACQLQTWPTKGRWYARETCPSTRERDLSRDLSSNIILRAAIVEESSKTVSTHFRFVQF